MKKTFKVKGQRQLDNAYNEWSQSIGKDPINNPARKIEKTKNKVTVTTVNGDILTFVIKNS